MRRVVDHILDLDHIARHAFHGAEAIGQPHFHRARAALCARLSDQERYDEARGLTQEGLERAPQDAELRQIEARLLAQRGQLADAINLLRLNAPPLSAEPQYHALLASLHLKAGAGSAASGLYRALLVRDPQDADHWMGLAAGEDLSGNTEDARSAYRKAVDLGLNGALLNFAQTRLKDLGE